MKFQENVCFSMTDPCNTLDLENIRFQSKIQYLALRLPLNPYQYFQKFIFYGPLHLVHTKCPKPGRH